MQTLKRAPLPEGFAIPDKYSELEISNAAVMLWQRHKLGRTRSLEDAELAWAELRAQSAEVQHQYLLQDAVRDVRLMPRVSQRKRLRAAPQHAAAATIVAAASHTPLSQQVQSAQQRELQLAQPVQLHPRGSVYLKASCPLSWATLNLSSLKSPAQAGLQQSIATLT